MPRMPGNDSLPHESPPTVSMKVLSKPGWQAALSLARWVDSKFSMEINCNHAWLNVRNPVLSEIFIQSSDSNAIQSQSFQTSSYTGASHSQTPLPRLVLVCCRRRFGTRKRTLCHGTFAELTWLSQAALQPFLSRLYCAQRSTVCVHTVSSDLFALQDGSYSASTMAVSREL